MENFFLIFFICALFPPIATQFFSEPVPASSYYVSRITLNCSDQTDTLYNGETTYENRNRYSKEGSYCVIVIVTSFDNNSTKTVIRRGATGVSNIYRNVATHQCSFSTAMDIGYGNCTPYYYQAAASIQLCICSTNYCSDNYTSCQASVNQALSSPPPLLPVLKPLSNTITCQDYYANYSASHNFTPIYFGCLYLIMGEPDVSKCVPYIVNHAALCAVYYISTLGSYNQMAMIEGNYEEYMGSVIALVAAINDNSAIGYQYQSSTGITIISTGDSGYSGMCFCTTNNCNVDFATCTSGMNIPPYPFVDNGSTTASTNSASTLKITTLQSSTAISVANSTVNSSISIRSTTTLPSNTTSSSLSEKTFYSK